MNIKMLSIDTMSKVSRAVKGARLKILYFGFVGSNPTSCNYNIVQ